LSIKLAAEFEHFPFQALDLDFASRSVGGEAAQFLDIFFEALDFTWPIKASFVGDPFFFFCAAAHYATL